MSIEPLLPTAVVNAGTELRLIRVGRVVLEPRFGLQARVQTLCLSARDALGAGRAERSQLTPPWAATETWVS